MRHGWANSATFDTVKGGTPSIGPPRDFGGGGGIGADLPGTSLAYGVVNYTMFHLSHKTFLTVRNEWTKDEHGTRYGFAGNYTSHTIGLAHHFSENFQIRPEIGYYRNYNQRAFDNGAKQGMWLYGFDVILRF